jgi:hypothetical protein
MADLEKGAQAIKDLLYVRINCKELAEPPEPSPPDKP